MGNTQVANKNDLIAVEEGAVRGLFTTKVCMYVCLYVCMYVCMYLYNVYLCHAHCSLLLA